MIFRIVVMYLGVLKHVPLLPHLFDAFLKMFYLFFHPGVIRCMDEIERIVSGWDDVHVSMHKFGGVQFNYHQTEIGHMHGNGLLDIRFNLKKKKQLLAEGRAEEHHVFKNSGWVSMHIRSEADLENAITLLAERLAEIKTRGEAMRHFTQTLEKVLHESA